MGGSSEPQRWVTTALRGWPGQGVAVMELIMFCVANHHSTYLTKLYFDDSVSPFLNIFNLMEMVIRAYDPCLSCATHSMDSQMRLAEVDIVDSEGNLIKKF